MKKNILKRRVYQNLIEGFLTLLFPPNMTCPICREEYTKGEGLCSSCRYALEIWREEPCCRVCGRLMKGAKGLCLSCQEEMPPFVLARAAAPYDGVFRQVVKRLKFNGEQWLGEPLGSIMAEMILKEPLFGEPDLIIPIPLHHRRLRERGFNQSGVLAHELKSNLGIAVGEGVLVKVRETPDQIGLSREERLANLKGVFKVAKPQDIYGRSVLLVDDIFTTGSTVAHGTEALLLAGAGRVAVATWASGAI